MKLQDVEFGINVYGDIMIRDINNRTEAINVTKEFMVTLITYMDFMQLNNNEGVKWEYIRDNGIKEVLVIYHKRVENESNKDSKI